MLHSSPMESSPDLSPTATETGIILRGLGSARTPFGDNLKVRPVWNTNWEESNWRTVDVGCGEYATSEDPRGLSVWKHCPLPIPIIARIIYEDTKHLKHSKRKLSHRRRNMVINRQIRRICWMSQMYPRHDISAEDIDEADIGGECLMCEYRRNMGEKSACFYFTSERTIMLYI